MSFHNTSNSSQVLVLYRPRPVTFLLTPLTTFKESKIKKKKPILPLDSLKKIKENKIIFWETPRVK